VVIEGLVSDGGDLPGKVRSALPGVKPRDMELASETGFSPRPDTTLTKRHDGESVKERLFMLRVSYI
jgi:hypothetical protein